MTSKARIRLLKLVQILIIIVCFWYLLHDMDLSQLLEAVQSRSFSCIPLFSALFVLFILPAGFRLNYLTRGRATLRTALAAFMFGNGVNSLLPAKLGEVAKAAYLARRRDIGAAEGLCVVFWERLADLNTVLLYAMALGLHFGISRFYLPLLAALAAIWCCMLLLFRFSGVFVRMTGYLPWEGVRGFTRSLVERLGGAEYRPRWAVLFALSLVLWFLYILYTYWFLTSVCDLTPGLWGAALVCIAGGVGMILPSMPAGLGAYEAAVVAALSLLGVDKAPALGAALLLHLSQMLPFVLFAGYMLMREDFHLRPKPVPPENADAQT